jgi:hypothetical protein
MRSIHYTYLLLAVAMALSGCVSSSAIVIPTRTETPLSSPISIPSTSTPRPTQTATIAPPATLDVEQAKATLKALVQEPVDCEAPCFWGIQPGQTTLSEAINIFTHLGLQVKSTNYQGRDFYGIKYDFNSGLSILATLTVQDNTVTDLRVDLTPETQKVGSQREWLAYSPKTLINRYGPPSSVNFILDWGPRSFFDMVMRFDSVNLIAEYNAYDIIPRQKGSPNIRPLTAQFEFVGLWMGNNPVYQPAEGVPLEEATSMTMEEFSKLMTGDPKKACFKLKGEMFP